jgi:hypothetical protein
MLNIVSFFHNHVVGTSSVIFKLKIKKKDRFFCLRKRDLFENSKEEKFIKVSIREKMYKIEIRIKV